jgi:hypothetical protein
VRFKKKQRGWFDSFEGAGHPGAGSQLAPFGGGISHPVIGVEGVFFGMGEDDGGFKVTNGPCEPLHSRPVQFQRVIAQIQGLETGPQDAGRLLRSARRMALTFSSVWPGSFQSSPDSPRSPCERAMTLAVPPFWATVAIAPL